MPDAESRLDYAIPVGDFFACSADFEADPGRCDAPVADGLLKADGGPPAFGTGALTSGSFLSYYFASLISYTLICSPLMAPAST